MFGKYREQVSMFAYFLLFVGLILGLALFGIKKENVNTIEVEGKQVEERTANPTYKNVLIAFVVFLVVGFVLAIVNFVSS